MQVALRGWAAYLGGVVKMDYNIRPANTFAAFSQGAQLKQEDKERKQQQRFGELAGTLYGAQDRTPILAEMAGINPQGAMQFGQQFANQDRVRQEQEAAVKAQKAKATVYKAQVIRTAPRESKLALLQQIAPDYYAQIGADGFTEEEINGIDAFIDQSMPQLYADAGMEPPAPPQPTQPRVVGRSLVGMNPDGTPNVLYRDPDAKQEQPGSQFTALTPDEVAKVGLPPGTSAQRDTRTGKIDVLSKRDNTATLSQKDATTARMKINTVALARKQLEDIRSAFLGKKDPKDPNKRSGGIKGTFSAGPGQGYLPTEGGNSFDAAVDQMRSTLTALTRVPGVGAMSDYETKLDQAKFPSRKNYEGVTEQQINALEDQLALIENGYRGLLGDTEQQGSQQPAQGQPVQVRSAAEAAALPPGTIFITPDGRRKVR